MVKKDKNWHYDSKETEWYHRHTKSIWPFRKEYYVSAGPMGCCFKCGNSVPQELMNLINEYPPEAGLTARNSFYSNGQ